MRSGASGSAGLQIDRVVAMLAASAVVGAAIFLVIRNQPIADPKLFFILRVMLSFGAATLGATIPGFLDIKWSRAGMAIRAGGALALFVLTFVYTPDLVASGVATGGSINQSSSGNGSPPILDNKGTIIINGDKK